MNAATKLPTDVGAIHFVGIGGIGMSGIAEVLMNLGYLVQGSDLKASKITDRLEQMGAKLFIGQRAENLENAAVVVVSSAIKPGNPELDAARLQGLPVVRRAEMLAELMRLRSNVAVAGTHGKTTITAILGHIMKETGAAATSFLGGIAENYQSNLILGGDEVSVVEADEFDRSFLQLSPQIACINAMDADHLDIYGSAEALTASFQAFSQKVTGDLYVQKGLPIEGITYGLEVGAAYDARNIRIEQGQYVFDLKTPTDYIHNIKTTLPGRHNVLNTVAALAMANGYGIPLTAIARALLTFKGIKRRFSYRLKSEDRVLIDDYAHHPAEIDAVVNAVRELYPSKEVLGVFQPHLFSRTRDFADDFARSLSQLDALILLDIYPAREEAIPGVTSALIVNECLPHFGDKCHFVPDLDDLEESLDSLVRPNDLVITLGAGSIWRYSESYANHLETVKHGVSG